MNTVIIEGLRNKGILDNYILTGMIAYVTIEGTITDDHITAGYHFSSRWIVVVADAVVLSIQIA